MSGPEADIKVAREYSDMVGKFFTHGLDNDDSIAGCCLTPVAPIACALFLVDVPLSFIGDSAYWGLVAPFRHVDATPIPESHEK